MPEIAEIARTVHYIRKLLVGKTLARVTATEDTIVYGKVGTSAEEFEKHMAGKTIVDAGQQGKYFWMIMSSPPHPVMHFGMTGWLKFKDEHTYYYQPKDDKKDEPWPPRFAKFILETKPEKGEEAIEAAFVDMRRLARIRLVDCPGGEIRQNTPLKENGPDPVIDKDIVTLDWLKQKCNAKKVPIKAMLLDQANISGIGNWVGDEVLFQAKIHPEQYANTLQDEQITQLHKSIDYVCSTAVELLADSDKYPENWLFKHRWQKGKKDATNKLPTGEKILFVTVGGRTSAVVPSIQKKTGPVAKDVDDPRMLEESDGDAAPKLNKGKKRKAVKEEDDKEEAEEKPKKAKGRKGKASKEEDEENQPPTTSKGRKAKAVKDEEVEDEEEEEVMPKKTTARGKKAAQAKVDTKTEEDAKPELELNGDTKPLKTKKVAKVATDTVEDEPAKPEKKSTGKGKATKAAAVDSTPDSGRRRSGRNR